MIMDRIETKLLSNRKSHFDTSVYIQKVILIFITIDQQVKEGNV
jgi:hypothetical protein